MTTSDTIRLSMATSCRVTCSPNGPIGSLTSTAHVASQRNFNAFHSQDNGSRPKWPPQHPIIYWSDGLLWKSTLMSSFNMNEISRSVDCRTSSKFLAHIKEEHNLRKVEMSAKFFSLKGTTTGIPRDVEHFNKANEQNFMNWNPSFKYSKHPTFISSCSSNSSDFEPLNNSLKFFYQIKFY